MIRILRESFTDQKLFATQKKQLSVSVNAIINYAKNHGQIDVAETIQGINSELQDELSKIENNEAEIEFSERTPLSDRDAALLLQTEGVTISDILDVYGAVKNVCAGLVSSIKENKVSKGQLNLTNLEITVKGPDGKEEPKSIAGSEKIVGRLIRSNDSVSGLAIGPLERVIAAAIDGKVGNGRKFADVVDDKGNDFCEVKYLKTLKSQCHSSLGKPVTCPTVVFYGAEFNPSYFIIPTTSDLSQFFDPVDISKNKQRLNMVLKDDAVNRLDELANAKPIEIPKAPKAPNPPETSAEETNNESYEIVG